MLIDSILMNHRRGKLLTFVLIIGFLIQAYSLIFLFNWDAFQISYLEIPPWLWTYQFILTLFTIASLMGVWLLKKWAVFLSVIVAVIFLVVEFALIRNLQSLPLNLSTAISMYLIILLIWFYVIFRKWKNFS